MAFFSKFSIRNFRGFQEEQTLVFAVPIAEKLGSGITYLVGANNSGKTTIVEGLAMHKDNKIRSSEKQKSGGPQFILYGDDGNVKRDAHLIRTESNTIVEAPELPDADIYEIISSRRHWHSEAGGNVDTSSALAQSGKTFTRQDSGVQTSAILKNIEKDDQKYKEFISLVKEIIPEFQKFAIGFEENEFIEYISGSGVKHKTDFLGDGVISVIRILSHLYNKSSKMLIIDEPELSLHPLAQKRLLKLIAKYSQERQILISTHSPYFIEWEYIRNGAKLNRVTKEQDIKSQIYSLKDYSTYEALINGGNWQQPYLVDVVSKEVFFQENILFLEGQEDVGLLRDYFKDNDINIFGYGVRGYNGFEFALQLAADLGIKKAAVILDSPTVSNVNKTPNENTIKATLESKFALQGYKVLQWSKTDIRDKKPFTSEEKIGYFSDKGQLKDAAELEDFNDKIEQIKTYFQVESSIPAGSQNNSSEVPTEKPL